MELCILLDCSHEWGERGIWSCAYCWTVAMNGAAEKEGYGAKLKIKTPLHPFAYCFFFCFFLCLITYMLGNIMQCS